MCSSTTVLVSAFAPLRSFALNVPSSTEISDVVDAVFAHYALSHGLKTRLTLSPPRGVLPPLSAPVSTLHGAEYSASPLVSLRLAPRLCGGKGGFGSQLRAAGGRMSSQKTSNNDSCRDLNGRRLSTIKEAKKLADYIQSEPERKKAAQEAQKAKLEKLERRLGISTDGTEAETTTGKKRRFNDTEFVEQSRDINDNVRSAVASALMKKRKKAKTIGNEAQLSTPSTAVATIASAAQVIVESATTAPAVAAIAVATSVASA